MDRWEEKLLEKARDIAKHGWGEVTMLASEQKGKIQITVKTGKNWRFFIPKRKVIQAEKGRDS